MEQLQHGNNLTSKIKAYSQLWEDRCYSDGIPDEVPEKLAKSLRVPSWKAIAIAILRNDHQLKTLGFSGTHTDWAEALKREKERIESDQLDLF
jgi:predicted phosphoadenosine phosphosulfate sulfurtransferase